MFGWLFRQKKRLSIKLIDEPDFEKFLQSLGAEELLGGGAHCVACGREIMIEDIDAVFPRDNQVRFICNRPKCMLSVRGQDNAV